VVPPVTSRRVLTTAPGTQTGAFGPVEWSLFFGIGLIWGASFLFIAIGLDAFRPGLITWLRVGLGAAVLWAVPRARARKIEREDWPRLITLSFLWVAIPFTLFPLAEQWINSAITGMLNGATPIITATIAAMLLRRLPRRRHLVGLAAGFAGILAIGLPAAGHGTAQATGVALVLAATLCYGISITIAAPIQQRYGALPVMARMLALATVWTAPFGLISARDSSFLLSSAIAVAILGMVGTGLAFVLMGTLVARAGSTRASFVTYLIPVGALALGVVFRGDHVALVSIAGVGLVITGALLASASDR